MGDAIFYQAGKKRFQRHLHKIGQKNQKNINQYGSLNQLGTRFAILYHGVPDLGIYIFYPYARYRCAGSCSSAAALFMHYQKDTGTCNCSISLPMDAL